MRDIGLRTIARLCEQTMTPHKGGINSADAVLPDSYKNAISTITNPITVSDNMQDGYSFLLIKLFAI